LGILVVFIVFPLLYLMSLFYKEQKFFFQGFIHHSFRLYFWFLQKSVPGLTIQIDNLKDIQSIKSSVILLNHLSHLDAILLLSVVKKMVIITKPMYFKIPVLGWLIYLAGYIPASRQSQFNFKSFDMLESIEDYFQSGGNLLIFPEGRRSHTGQLNPFKKGPFSLIQKLNKPLEILCLKNTDNLFGINDSLIFNFSEKNTISLKRIDQIIPDFHESPNNPLHAKTLKDKVYQIYLKEYQSGERE